MSALRKITRTLLGGSQSLRGLSSRAGVGGPFEDDNHDYNKNNEALISAVQDAEKVLGYSTSFLRWNLTDEIAELANHMQSLLRTNHDFIHTANLMHENELPPWGLLVLLVSRAAGVKRRGSNLEEEDGATGVLRSQRVLSEVTEKMITSLMIRKCLIGISPENANFYNLNLGNRLATMSANHLERLSLIDIRHLDNPEVGENMTAALRDFSQWMLLEPRDERNRPLPSEPHFLQKEIPAVSYDHLRLPFNYRKISGYMKAEWTMRTTLGGASLLGRSCQSCMLLANHNRHKQEMAYFLGRNLASAWQIQLETDWFLKGHFALTAAPVMLHLELEPWYYEEIKKGLKNTDFVDRYFIRKAVVAGRALKRVHGLKGQFLRNVKHILASFDDSDSKKILLNIINAM